MLRHIIAASGFAALLAVSPAKADLVFSGPVAIGGTGLGAVDTILTMNGHGNSTVESGQVSWVCIAPHPCHDVVTGDPSPPGYTPAGSTQMTGINHTIPVSATGWTGTQSLGIVFNPSEPGAASQNSITLNKLELTIYNATTGAVLFDAPWLGGPMTLPAVDPGTGNSGYLFGLNLAETIELLASGVTANDRIGLLAYATNADGGNETFFGNVIAFDPNDPPDPADPPAVPEPASIAILGLGMLGLGTIRAVYRNSGKSRRPA